MATPFGRLLKICSVSVDFPAPGLPTIPMIIRLLAEALNAFMRSITWSSELIKSGTFTA